MRATLLILFVFVLTMEGCNPIGYVYGIKSSISKEGCDDFIEKIELNQQVLELNSSLYTSFLKNQIDSSYANYWVQPLQVLTFKEGTLFSHSVNCNVSGFPNLQWDFQVEDNCTLLGNITNPPMIALEDYLNAMGINLPSKNLASKFTTIVHINCVMGRQTEQLVEAVKALHLSCDLFYVNNSSFFIEEVHTN